MIVKLIENYISYYECTNYIPTLRSCSPDLYFNHLTQMCDLKSKVPCIMVPDVSEEEDNFIADGNCANKYNCVCVVYVILILFS